MAGFVSKIIKAPPPIEQIAKQIRYGTAAGLTRTAKQGQAAVLDALKSTFTLRGSWYEPGNRFGIKIEAAKRDKLEAAVQTRADWLEIHETGGERRPSKNYLAVPTDLVKRNKRQIIPRTQRPRNLKRSFVLQTKSGPVLFVRRVQKNARVTNEEKRPRRKRKKTTIIVPLYSLEKSVPVKQQSTFFEPISEVVRKHLRENIAREVKNALATMR